jgi:hypothetical protein
MCLSLFSPVFSPSNSSPQDKNAFGVTLAYFSNSLHPPAEFSWKREMELREFLHKT